MLVTALLGAVAGVSGLLAPLVLAGNGLSAGGIGVVIALTAVIFTASGALCTRIPSLRVDVRLVGATAAVVGATFLIPFVSFSTFAVSSFSSCRRERERSRLGRLRARPRALPREALATPIGGLMNVMWAGGGARRSARRRGGTQRRRREVGVRRDGGGGVRRWRRGCSCRGLEPRTRSRSSDTGHHAAAEPRDADQRPRRRSCAGSRLRESRLLARRRTGRIRRRYNGKRWIACRLEFRGWLRRPLMQPGRFTELFFLDEATAFAAGHRPCALCRREDYVRFVEIWREQHPGQVGADAIDAQLHGERVDAPTLARSFVTRLRSPICPMAPSSSSRDAPWLVLGQRLLRWTPAGYAERRPRPAHGHGRPDHASGARCSSASRMAARTRAAPTPVGSRALGAAPLLRLCLSPSPAARAAPRSGCGSASGGRPRPRRAAAPAPRRSGRGSAGSACGRRSPTAGRPRSGCRLRAGSGRGLRRRSSAPPRGAPRCTDGAGPSKTTSAGPSSCSRPR